MNWVMRLERRILWTVSYRAIVLLIAGLGAVVASAEQAQAPAGAITSACHVTD